MKAFMALLFTAAVMLCILGCEPQAVYTVDTAVWNETPGEALALAEGRVKLILEADMEGPISTEPLMTNTKEIAVLSRVIGRYGAIRLYLYNVEYEEPIAYATLSGWSRRAVFTGLTSAADYRVEAEAVGLEKDTELLVFDNPGFVFKLAESLGEIFN